MNLLKKIVHLPKDFRNFKSPQDRKRISAIGNRIVCASQYRSNWTLQFKRFNWAASGASIKAPLSHQRLMILGPVIERWLIGKRFELVKRLEHLLARLMNGLREERQDGKRKFLGTLLSFESGTAENTGITIEPFSASLVGPPQCVYRIHSVDFTADSTVCTLYTQPCAEPVVKLYYLSLLICKL